MTNGLCYNLAHVLGSPINCSDREAFRGQPGLIFGSFQCCWLWSAMNKSGSLCFDLGFAKSILSTRCTFYIPRQNPVHSHDKGVFLWVFTQCSWRTVRQENLCFLYTHLLPFTCPFIPMASMRMVTHRFSTLNHPEPDSPLMMRSGVHKKSPNPQQSPIESGKAQLQRRTPQPCIVTVWSHPSW